MWVRLPPCWRKASAIKVRSNASTAAARACTGAGSAPSPAFCGKWRSAGGNAQHRPLGHVAQFHAHCRASGSPAVAVAGRGQLWHGQLVARRAQHQKVLEEQRYVFTPLTQRRQIHRGDVRR